ELAVVPVRAAPRHGAGLAEAAGVEEPVDALAHCEPPGRVLARHALLPAHAAAERLAAAQLIEFGLPPHGLGSLCRERVGRGTRHNSRTGAILPRVVRP